MILKIMSECTSYVTDEITLVANLKEKCETSKFLREKELKEIKICSLYDNGEKYCLVFAEYSNDIMAVFALSEIAYGIVKIILAGKGRPFTVVVFSEEAKIFLEKKLKEKSKGKYGDTKVIIGT